MFLTTESISLQKGKCFIDTNIMISPDFSELLQHIFP